MSAKEVIVKLMFTFCLQTETLPSAFGTKLPCRLVAATLLLCLCCNLINAAGMQTTTGTGSDDLVVHPKVYCTKNEYECQRYQTCRQYSPLVCYRSPPCEVDSCVSDECYVCGGGEQHCVAIYSYSLDTGVTKCYCPGEGKLPLSNGTCIDAPGKCSGAFKDRYCDQKCELSEGLNVTCTCATGFSLTMQSGKFGEYGSCIPVVGEYGNQKMIVNGPISGEDWSFPNGGFITLNAPTALDRVQMRPSAQKIFNIYAITKDSKDRYNLTLFSENGHKTTTSYPILYSRDIQDFAMDWPSGNVYYISTSEPKLTVCNTLGTACRILEASKQLIAPSEIVIDSKLGYMIVADNSSLWKISLDGLKSTQIKLPSMARNLVLDYDNLYMHYLAAHDNSIYRVDYNALDSKTVPQKILWLVKTKEVGEITSMVSIGRQLFVAEYHKKQHRSIIYHNISTNPFTPQESSILASGPGKVKNLLMYHTSLVRSGAAQKIGRVCHIQLNGVCTCMEGYELEDASNSCVKVDLKTAGRDILLYMSPDEQLIQGIFAPNATTCPPTGLGTIPINPIRIPGSLTNLDLHLGYDTKDNVLYFSDQTAIWKAPVDGVGDRAQDTGWRATVGTHIYGIAINPSLRTLYYAEYSHINFHIIICSLDHPDKQARFLSSPSVSNRYFSTGLVGGSYEFRMIGIEASHPVISGNSMLHERTHDPKSGNFFDLGFGGEKTTDGYSYLLPNATQTSSRTQVLLGHRIICMSMGGNDLLHISDDSQRYRVVNTTSNESSECATMSASFLQYVRPNANISDTPAACMNCDGVCLQRPLGNFTCSCNKLNSTLNNGICLFGSSKCGVDEKICPGQDRICLDKSRVCDGVENCPDGTDEILFSVCPQAVRRCANGSVSCNVTGSRLECVLQSEICDGLVQCSNGADEIHCVVECAAFQCPISGFCYGIESLCDGISDCPELSKETYGCPNCSSSAYRCLGTTYCIPNVDKCDGHVDCPDGSDEWDCEDVFNQSRCLYNEKTCASGQCIAEIWWCDGTSDCADGSDEVSCKSVICAKDHIKCNKTGHCIPLSWRCDTHADCSDGEDELGCYDSMCHKLQFTCPATAEHNLTQCIGRSGVCNSRRDCVSGHDEDRCDSGACTPNPCSHDCIVNPDGGYWCQCPFDMELSRASNDTCVPSANRCGVWGICSQECVPLLDGKTKCKCHSNDYQIEPDLYTCSHIAGPPSLIFSNRHELRVLPTDPSTQYSVLIASLRNTIAVDYHYKKRLVFWSDVIADKIYRGQLNHDAKGGGVLTDVKTVITNGLPTAEGLAVDWLGDHIYWVESGLDIIEVADLDGSNRSTIISHSEENPMENPRSIAVDPRVGLLFWADWGIKQIRRATMAGEEQVKLFSVNDPKYIQDGGWANGLTLDYDMKRVYWNDAKSDTIQTVDYEGKGFHLVLSNSDLLKHPFSISVFENWVYWSDWRTNSINRANKWNGTNAQTVQSTVTQPFDLKVFHKGRQNDLEKGSKNLCSEDNGGCSHLCLRNSNTTIRCACPHLLELAADKKRCQPIEQFVLLTTASFLTSLSLEDSKSHGVMPTLARPIIDHVYMVDFYMSNNKSEQRLFWADEGMKVIASATALGANVTNIIDLDQAVEFGFAVDYIYKKLYVTTYSLKRDTDGTIDVCDFKGTRRATITTGLNRPMKIALQPSNGTMFVVDVGSKAIYHMYMNGSFFAANKSSSNIIKDTPLATISRDTRIVLSSEDHTKSVLYFGNKTHIFKYDGKSIAPVLSSDNHESVGAWFIQGSQLYYTAKFTNVSLPTGFDVKYQGLDNMKEFNGSKIGSVKGPFPTDLKLVDSNKIVILAKLVSCAHCNHHCLPNSTGSGAGTCVCYTGYSRSKDSPCQAISPMLLYAVNGADHGIHGLDITSMFASNKTSRSLPKIPQVYKPKAVDYYTSHNHSDYDYIYWIDSGHSITRTTRDLTDRKTIVSGLIEARDLVVDPQGGNVYWLDSFSGTVEVCKLDGSQRMILAQTNTSNKLISITLHPSKGYLFYLDTAMGIYRMTLGNERKIERLTTLPGSGHALTVDFVNNRLFVCDGLHQFMYMHLDGSNQTSVAVSDDRNCSAIAVFGASVFYAIDGKIWLKDITSSEPARSLLSMYSHVINDLAFARHDIQSYLDENSCADNNGGCDGLCLFNGDISASSHCVCAVGALNATTKKCDDLGEFVVFSKVTAIQYLPVSFGDVGSPVSTYKDLTSDKTMNVIALTVDPDRERIYFSDLQRRALSWVPYGKDTVQDILTDLDLVEGLAYDDGIIYFTHQSNTGANTPAIKYVNIANEEAGYEAKTIVELRKADAPRAIAIHSCSGYLFWSNWNEENPSIQRVETSGSHVISIVTENIVIPNGLAIDHKMEKLFWADANLDKIEMCDFLGHYCRIVMQQVSPHIFAMAIHGDFLYWTDWMQRTVRMAHKLDGSFNQTLGTKLPRQPMGIAIASNVTCKESPCHGSPCEQTCSVVGNGEGYSCGCYGGYLLDTKNLRNCTLMEGCHDHGFACQGDCIPWELTCDGVNHCPSSDGTGKAADEDPEFCAHRLCPGKFFTCRNMRCVPLSTTCDGIDDCGDLTDELSCDNRSSSCHILTQFPCTNGQCIPIINLCDGKPQCWDKSDELPPHCNSTQNVLIDCAAFDNPFYGSLTNGVKCDKTPVCIMEEWKCDGHNDCWDNSDEEDCDKPKSCAGEDEWECSGANSQANNIKQCILSLWRCDGDLDCTDESDEMGCENMKCPEGDFTCDNTLCIPDSWRCDGKIDCEDNSDERGCNSTTTPTITCTALEFACANKGACVPLRYLCDGENDCLDGSDEHQTQGCPRDRCASNEMSCNNGRCVNIEFFCDRFNDCLDSTDEPLTCTYTVCDLETQFECTNNQCIPLSAHCNGWPECSDGSDESNATCAPRPISSCSDGEWQCPQGACIAEERVCDGTADCDNLDDELACNLNECMEGNGGCSQICIDEKIHFHCGCYQGFRLSSDNRTCVDIDECIEKSPCSQICVNAPGTYHCRCAPAYTLRPDQSTCKPNRGANAYLLVANRYYIRNLTLNININGSDQSLVSRNMTNVVGLDYDWKEKMIYWTDVTNDQHNISRMRMNGTGKQILHSITTKHPDGLAVDWVGRNLYWSDNILNTIEVSRLDGRYRRALLTDISEPRALQLYPAKGYLFYTDWGQGAHIGRAGMDGSSQIKIVTERVGWPNALAIDIYAQKLFFGDAKLDYIAMTDLDGMNRKIVLDNGVNHIFSLTVFDDMLYWSDWDQNQIHRVHKFTGENKKTLATLIHRPMELRIVHELNQAYKGDNPCEKLNCSGLCLLKPLANNSGRLEAVCQCPDHYTIRADNKTCISECSTLFQCKNEFQCIHFTQECDGNIDCWDGSDEADCHPKAGHSRCRPYQFNCATHGVSDPECVDVDKLCDGVGDCSNGEDERIFAQCMFYQCMHGYYNCYNGTRFVCVNPDSICGNTPEFTCRGFNASSCDSEETTCAASEFRCVKSGKCIPYVYHCDGEVDCSDRSDEINETCNDNVACRSGYVSCGNSGQCIPESWVCDGDKDCQNGEDEVSGRCAESSCPSGYTQCNDKKCIPQRWLCDYEPDCKDGGDEKDCNPRKCSESEDMCLSDSKCIHSSKLCNGYADCSDGSDEIYCNGTECMKGLFKCNDDQTRHCLPDTWKCDGTVDCKDMSDETNCSGRHCSKGEFGCKNSICISSAFKCDGQDDCRDGSDETSKICESNKCLPNRFRCGNNKCIPVALLCDEKDDCGDNSDENRRNCKHKCGDGQFQCPNEGPCIDSSKVCDGQVDCPFATDAMGHRCMGGKCPAEISSDEQNVDFVCRRVVGGCLNVRATLMFIWKFQTVRKMRDNCNANIKCKDHTSHPEIVKNSSLVQITCLKGYQVSVKHALDHCRVCEDKNECLEYGSCGQICKNSPGEYNCTCQPGFSLEKSAHPGREHDCVLIDSEEPPYLLMADGNVLRSYDLSRGKDKKHTERQSFLSYVNSTSRIDSITLDLLGEQWTAYILSYHSKSILKFDISSLQPNSRRKRRVSSIFKHSQQSTAGKSQAMSPPEVVRANLRNPQSITFDWVHRTLYWVDATSATISMLDVDSSLEATIVTTENMLAAIKDRHFSPRSITVDPTISAKIFWTDCCGEPRIWSADLNGTNPKMLTNDIERPSDIVCDVSNQRLYWTDAKKKTVSTMTVHGDNPRVIYTFTDEMMQPNSIDVFGHELIVTSMDRDRVVALNKFVGLDDSYYSINSSNIVYSPVLHVGDISIVHAAKPHHIADPHCYCGPSTIVTESFHEGNLRCSCVCADDHTRLNETHCHYCPCRNKGECSNEPGQTVKCVCPVGFGGYRCDLNLCENYCSRDAVCEVLNGDPYCKCKPHMTGERCTESKCDHYECQNGGRCHVDDGGLPYCMCKTMYKGRNCEQKITDLCEERCTSPQGLTCTGGSSRFSYNCTCSQGYTGVDCHNCIHTKFNNTLYGCHGRGVCTSEGGIQKCKCTVGDFDPITQCLDSLCKGQKCINGGTCIVNESEGKKITSCHCPPYFTGERCEIRMTCITGYCHNGGTCIEDANDLKKNPAKCLCLPDFVGRTCSKQCIPSCVEKMCQLLLANESPVCACPHGRHGDKCQYTDQCDDHCHNGGICIGCLANLTDHNCNNCCNCSCTGGWKDDRCLTAVTKLVTNTEKPATQRMPIYSVVITCSVIGVTLLVVLIVIVVVVKKRRRRRMLFEHLRLTEDRDDTMEVTNPMYMKTFNEEGNLEDELEDDEYSVYSASNTSNFANPLYSLGGAKKSKKKGEERTLLINDGDEDEH